MRKDKGKTKEQLIDELKPLRQQNTTLGANSRQAEHYLTERMKELNCFYNITRGNIY